MNNTFESDVDYFSDTLDEAARIKAAVWSDDSFRELIADYGLVEALTAVTDFHRNLATQLKAQGVTSTEDSEWARRTIGLCVRVKSRRQQLRRAVRDSFDDGDAIVARINANIISDWGD